MSKGRTSSIGKPTYRSPKRIPHNEQSLAVASNEWYVCIRKQLLESPGMYLIHSLNGVVLLYFCLNSIGHSLRINKVDATFLKLKKRSLHDR